MDSQTEARCSFMPPFIARNRNMTNDNFIDFENEYNVNTQEIWETKVFINN
jgi:hypothetical protein